MSSKRIARISILAALAVVLRFAFVAFPNIKPITAIFLVSAVFLGLLDSLLIMTLTMLVTGIYLGFGPVVLWQILSFSLVLCLWDIIVVPMIEQKRLALWGQALLAAIVVMVYGFLISLFSAYYFGFSPLIFWLNGLSFDGLHASSTFIFYPIIYSIFRRFLQ